MAGRATTTRKAMALLAGVLAVGTSLSACRGDSDTSANGKNCTLKIGVLEPLSGAAASLGVPVYDGAKLAAANANKTHQSKCKVTLKAQDYQSDTSTAVTRAQRLITDRVYGIIGPNQGSATLAIAPVVNKSKVPICAFNNTISITGSDNPYVFRCQSNDADNVRAAILFAKQKFKAKSLVVLHTDDAYGTDAANAMKSVAKESSTSIKLLDDISFAYNATDVTSEWSRAKSDNPDAYVLWGSGTSMAVALRNAQQLGVKAPIIGSQGLSSQAIIDAAGPAAQGVYTVGLIDPSKTTTEQATVAKLLKKEHGAKYQPTLYNYIGWDAVQLMIKAHAKDPDDAKAGLEKLGPQPLASGTYTFTKSDHNGLGLKSIWITQVQNGRFVGVTTGLLKK